MQTIRERLLWARTTAGLTTRELATAAGVAEGYPSAVERGRVKTPSIGALQKLSGALGVSFDWLCWGRGKDPSEATLKRHAKPVKGTAHP